MEGQPGTIMIVDDSPEDLRLLSQILQAHGYKVRPMIRANLALQSMKLQPPDILLLDVRMPGIDGYSLCEELKAHENTCDIPIIFISALNDPEDKVHGFQLGGVDFITKPFHSEEVIARISTHYALRQQRRQLQHELQERQRAEEALRENQRFITRITEMIPMFVYVYDLHKHIFLYSNRSIQSIFGVSEETIEQSPDFLSSRVHLDDRPRLLAHIQQLRTATNSRVFECTYRLQHADNQWRWIQQYNMVFTQLDDGTPSEIIGTAMDITEQYQIDRMLHQQQQALAILRERERLTRELHDTIGQVLSAVNTQSQAAYDLICRGRPDVATPFLSSIIDMTKETQIDVREFIIGTHISMDLNLASHQPRLIAALNEHCVQLKHLYEFTIDLHASEEISSLALSPIVEVQLLRIIQEALTNICKHAQVSSAEVELLLSDETLHIVIKDYGKGFDMQVANGTSKSSHFGLQSMRGRAEEIGGTLVIDSELEKGTMVSITVPLYEQDRQQELTMRVLLVDDNQPFLQGLQAMLESRSVNVVGTANDGKQALEQARALQPDVILMDIEMPTMNGIEATRHISQELPDTQIIMFSISEENEHLFEAIRSGAQGYLTKDTNADSLYEMLVELSYGEVVFSRGLAKRLLREFSDTSFSSSITPSILTPRQHEILTCVAKGMTYQQVANTLYCSEATVKYHMGTIIRKLHLKNRDDAIAFARHHHMHSS